MVPDLCRIVSHRQFFWQFFWQSAVFRTFLDKLPLNFNDLINGSRGRTRTFNPTVNSRVLYH